jgi:hypothetical protein
MFDKLSGSLYFHWISVFKRKVYVIAKKAEATKSNLRNVPYRTLLKKRVPYNTLNKKVRYGTI